MKLKEGFISPISKVRHQYKVQQKNAEIGRKLAAHEEFNRYLLAVEKRTQAYKKYGIVILD